MAIDLKTETPITLAEVGRYLPRGRGGARVSLSCALRWVVKGVKCADGRVVYLEAIRMGGRLITTVEALNRFGEAQTVCPDPTVEARPPIRTPKARQRASERAARELAKLGI